ncbi:MAG: hypothetical protein RI894_1337 [Bacteroidota bacterium]|jgi:muconolactone delta-isomerase
MQYLVTITLPDEMTIDFMALVPTHRARINKLMQRGIILSYALNMERTRLWIIMNVKEEEEVDSLLHGLPLHPYFLNYDTHLLMFHNTVSGALPSISLN